MSARFTTLPNGLRVASIAMPSSQTVAVGIWSAVGGRHEAGHEGGVSHFLEHLLFKGTKKRTARQISEEIEGVGGDLNAFTSEERTCYHAAASMEHLERITGVLSDMYRHSVLDPEEVERERNVIAEEIEMVRDEPSQHVHELLCAETWNGDALGRPITGTKQSLSAISRKDLTRHLRSHYTGARTILSVAGATDVLDHEKIVKLAAKELGRIPKGCTAPVSRPPRRQSSPRIVIETRDSQQTQLALSFRALGARDPRRFAASLLHVILGGNMSSRLFQELREARGLCYSVSSSLSTYSDCGSFEISLGLDGGNITKALRLILRECRRIELKSPSAAELKRACDYSIGTSRMALERASTQSYRLGNSLLTHGRIIAPEEVYERLARVTPEEVRKVASQVLNRRTLCLAMVGPGPSRKDLFEIVAG